MRAVMSLARFLTVMAAICVAFSVAISGPPTQTELSWARDALGRVWRNLVGASAGVEAQACATAVVLCPEEQAAAEVRDEPRPIEAPPAPPPLLREEPSPAPPQRSAEPLLGGSDYAARSPTARVAQAERVEPRRAARRSARREHVRNRPPPPLPPVGARRADAIEAGPASALAEVRPSQIPELSEQPAAYEADWPADWDQYRDAPNDEYEEEADAYDDEAAPAYEEDDDHTRARFWRRPAW